MDRSAQGPTEDDVDVTIDLRPLEVDVPLSDGDLLPVDLRDHRADVVRRLLLLGASERVLTTLLPDWIDLIERTAADPAEG